MTGIQAGANISGDLKDPASSIPVGTLLALLISMFSYVLFVFFAGGAALRDVSGIIINNGTNATIASCIPGVDCEYGLHNSYSVSACGSPATKFKKSTSNESTFFFCIFQVMQLMSFWAPFIYAGCFAATLSTALTNLLSVPRLIQALGQDRIYPGLIYFSKGYGKNNEPYRGYVLTFFVAAVFLLIGEHFKLSPIYFRRTLRKIISRLDEIFPWFKKFCSFILLIEKILTNMPRPTCYFLNHSICNNEAKWT